MSPSTLDEENEFDRCLQCPILKIFDKLVYVLIALAVGEKIWLVVEKLWLK